MSLNLLDINHKEYQCKAVSSSVKNWESRELWITDVQEDGQAYISTC